MAAVPTVADPAEVGPSMNKADAVRGLVEVLQGRVPPEMLAALAKKTRASNAIAFAPLFAGVVVVFRGLSGGCSTSCLLWRCWRVPSMLASVQCA